MTIPSEKFLAPHLKGLNPPQLEAVTHFTGPILVLAGAGSGKTRVLTRRIAHLVVHHQVHPERILAVTFTNKATEEMRQRIKALLGTEGEGVWVATFHSACVRILRRYANKIGYTNDFAIYDDNDSQTVMKGILKEEGIDDKKVGTRKYLSAIDRYKNENISYQEARAKASFAEEREAAHLYELYQKALFQANAMDFGDLLLNVARLFKEHPEVLERFQQFLEFILVDEFQDTNKIQYLLIRQLTAGKRNILVVGDDDQSIYAFRGATIQNILTFEKDFPETKVIKLEQNYRSTKNILDAAYGVISQNKRRKEKRLWTAEEGGEKIHYYEASDETEEAEYVATRIQAEQRRGKKLSEIAIFYRTNAQSRAIEEAFMKYRIPYRIFGGLKFYDRKEIKDVLAYLRVLLNPNDIQSFLRIINTPTRGIGPQSVAALEALHRERNASSEERYPFWEVIREIGERNRHIGAFAAIIEELMEAKFSLRPAELIEKTLALTEYVVKLKLSEDSSFESRIENLKELQAVARSIEESERTPEENLRDFLDRVSLSSSADIVENRDEPHRDSPGTVSMMTLHLAKGLEFPCVFFTGLEEGILPHQRSIDDPESLEEERRLCYVGVTRAMQTLYLSRAEFRGMSGSGGYPGFKVPSRFLFDIPEVVLDATPSRSSNRRQSQYHEEDWDSSDSWSRKRTYRRDSGTPSSPFSRKESTTSSRLGSLSTFLKPADALQKNELAPLPHKVELEALQEGVRVRHVAFGTGVIQEIENNLDAPEKTKILIQFEKHSTPKRLVYQYIQNLVEVFND